VLTLVIGLSVTRRHTSNERLHLGLQLHTEGGPHFTRSHSESRPYKHDQGTVSSVTPSAFAKAAPAESRCYCKH
jgi:phosphate-selective porin